MNHNLKKSTLNPVFLIIIFISGALFFLYSASTIRQIGFLDPYMYAGYVNDYRGTFERYGLTYYSSRLAYIVPDMLFQKAMGAELGYSFLRLLLIFGASIAVYSVSVRKYSPIVGLLSCFWLFSTSWLTNSLRWTHYDGFAAAYLLIAIALYICCSRFPKRCLILSGLFYYFAVNCNMVLVVIGGLFYATWTFIGPLETLRSRLHKLIWVALGFAFGSMLISLAFFLLTGLLSFSIETTAISMSKALINGAAKAWFFDFPKLIKLGHFLFIIPVIFLTLSISWLISTWVRRKSIESYDYFELKAYVYFSLIFLFSILMHYVYYVAIFSLFYYVVYFAPSVVLIIISMLGKITQKNKKPNTLTFFFFVSLILIIGGKNEMARLQSTLEPLHVLYFYVFIALAVSASSLFLFFKSNIYQGLFLILLTTLTTVNLNAIEKKSVSPFPDREWDSYLAARNFQNSINSTVPLNRPLKFWYTNSDSSLDSIQSMFLWGYSRLATPGAPFSGMPEFEKSFPEKLGAGTFLVLLGSQHQEVEVGLEVLRKQGISFKSIKSDQVILNKTSLFFQVIEIKP